MNADHYLALEQAHREILSCCSRLVDARARVTEAMDALAAARSGYDALAALTYGTAGGRQQTDLDESPWQPSGDQAGDHHGDAQGH